MTATTQKTNFRAKARLLTLRLTSAIALSAIIVQPAAAQTVADNSVPTADLNLPANARLLGNSDPNVYRPSATVNGEIITATDVEQRLALIRIANDGNIPPEELQRVRLQIFSQLIDEVLQIQEAAANKIDIDVADIDREVARIAAGRRQTPEQFAQFLAANGSSIQAIRQQIKADVAWQNVLGRNVEPFTQVSQEEVQSIVDRINSQRGSQEFRIGEIYLPSTPDTAAAVMENATRIIQALGEGASFQDLARRFSQASSAAQGGDLGWVRMDQLPASLSSVAAGMSPNQLAGPIAVPGGLSILYLIDRRQVLTADPRDAVLSLKQVVLNFAPGTSETEATALASQFATQTQMIAGCGGTEDIARRFGADVISRDQISMRDLPPQLQAALSQMQIGQVTPPFGSPEQGVSVLVLCGRDMAQANALPSTEDIAENMRSERVRRRAERYMRDLRRDAVIDYS